MAWNQGICWFHPPMGAWISFRRARGQKSVVETIGLLPKRGCTSRIAVQMKKTWGFARIWTARRCFCVCALIPLLWLHSHLTISEPSKWRKMPHWAINFNVWIDFKARDLPAWRMRLSSKRLFAMMWRAGKHRNSAKILFYRPWASKCQTQLQTARRNTFDGKRHLQWTAV